MGKLANIKNHFVEYVRGKDAYAKTVNFTIKGEDSYTTFFGGFVSMIVTFIGLAYTIVLLNDLFNKKFVSVTSTSNYVSAEEDDSIVISDTNFAFAFYVEGLSYDDLTNNNIFWINIYQSYYVFDQSGNIVDSQSTPIAYSRCNESDGAFAQYLSDTSYLNFYLCPQTRADFRIRGQWSVSEIVEHYDFLIGICDETQVVG